MIFEYLRWLASFADPIHIVDAFRAVPSLITGGNLFFWLTVFGVVRYHLPDLAVWVAYVFNRRAFEPPPLRKYAGAEPLISVVIAGRNPSSSIVKCIESVLQGTYKNVEIIFADDKSTDDSVALARSFERTGKVRVFANANHSGKPANLNLAINFVRGDFIFVLDSDTQIEPNTFYTMLPYFEDERVGAVCPGIYVRNGTKSIMTRFQRIEYLLTFVLNQIWRSQLGLITIIPGMGGMFRTKAIKGLGGFDMGLGDDTDLTLRLRKARWKLKMSLRGRVSTDVPVTAAHLRKQRARWTRNMVKVRLRKHRDMGTFRYGFINGALWWENVANRVMHPFLIVGLIVYVHFKYGLEHPLLFGGLYLFVTVLLFWKILIAGDLTGESLMGQFWLVPVLHLVPAAAPARAGDTSRPRGADDQNVAPVRAAPDLGSDPVPLTSQALQHLDR